MSHSRIGSASSAWPSNLTRQPSPVKRIVKSTLSSQNDPRTRQIRHLKNESVRDKAPLPRMALKSIEILFMSIYHGPCGELYRISLDIPSQYVHKSHYVLCFFINMNINIYIYIASGNMYIYIHICK